MDSVRFNLCFCNHPGNDPETGILMTTEYYSFWIEKRTGNDPEMEILMTTEIDLQRSGYDRRE